MLTRQAQLEAAQSEGRTIVDYLIGAVLKESPVSWRDFVMTDVSDVDDARSIALIPSDTNLTLFEREVSKGDSPLLRCDPASIGTGEYPGALVLWRN
jgi:chromosome partitioning protein